MPKRPPPRSGPKSKGPKDPSSPRRSPPPAPKGGWAAKKRADKEAAAAGAARPSAPRPSAPPPKPAAAPRDEPGSGLKRRYEGEEVLLGLLEIGGSELDVESVKALFAEAQADGLSPSEVFPDLFEEEPRFPEPSMARRLYGNLFGLWDRISRGKSEEPGQAELEREVEVVPPPQIEGRQLEQPFIDAALRVLGELPERELRKQRDRFEGGQEALLQSLSLLSLSPQGEVAGADLGFELWLLCGWALGERRGTPTFAQLRERTAPASVQPALLLFASEWLDAAMQEEEDALTPADREALLPLFTQAIARLAP